MMEPLRLFLIDSLPEKPEELDEHEVITDAIVLYRVVDPSGPALERYRYTVTDGVSLAMAMGMIEISKTTLMDYYTSMLAEEEDEDGD